MSEDLRREGRRRERECVELGREWGEWERKQLEIFFDGCFWNPITSFGLSGDLKVYFSGLSFLLDVGDQSVDVSVSPIWRVCRNKELHLLHGYGRCFHLSASNETLKKFCKASFEV